MILYFSEILSNFYIFKLCFCCFTAQVQDFQYGYSVPVCVVLLHRKFQLCKLRYIHSKFILSFLDITLEKWWMITNNINSSVGCGGKDPRGGLELGWTQSIYIPSQVLQIINHKSQIFCDVCWTLKCRKNKKLVLQRYLLNSESVSKMRDSPLELSHYLTKYLRWKFLHEHWSLMDFAIEWTLS